MLVDSEFKLNFSLIDEIEPVGNVAFAKNGLVRGKLRFHCIEGEGGQMVGVQSIEKGVGSDSGLEGVKPGLRFRHKDSGFGFHTNSVEFMLANFCLRP